MRKGFIKGFITGIVATAIVSIVIIGPVKKFIVNKVISDTSVSEITADKVDYLQSVIEDSYLEDIDKEELENGIYKGLLEGLDDPYSVYYTPEEYKELMESASGNYCGIGVVVGQNADTGIITVVRTFKGAPGEEAGIKVDDVIYSVEGQEVSGEELSEVVSRMKGDENTKVKITVYRPSTKKYIDLEIERRKIDVPTVEHKMLDNNVGYIQIIEFDEVTYEQFKKAVNDLQEQGMTSVIFDVRSNPGGIYSVVVDILDDLLPEGTLVYTEDRNGKKVIQSSDKEYLDMPMVVLQNENSASAAEIFAGAIQDYKAGTIVGTQSFGKGIVQSIMPLTDGSAIKLTIEKYFTPNGVNIHKKGITPDVKVEDERQSAEDKDNQLEKAIDILSQDE